MRSFWRRERSSVKRAESVCMVRYAAYRFIALLVRVGLFNLILIVLLLIFLLMFRVEIVSARNCPRQALLEYISSFPVRFLIM